MAAIVRVKRRLDEDPAESLLLSCKKLKLKNQCDLQTSSDPEAVTSVFKFAGTLPSKTDVTVHVRDAIRREKLQREYKSHGGDISARVRGARAAASSNNRYKVVSSRRAMDLESLDDDATSHSPENTCSLQQSAAPSDNDASLPTDTVNTNISDDSSQQSDKSARMFCLYDIEEEPRTSETEVPDAPSQPETVTCNGVTMVREKVTKVTKPRPCTDPHQYVYDVYYMNNAKFDFRSLEHILAIEAYQEDLMLLDSRGGTAAADVGDDEDSNDEGHWQNDYPDDDEVLGDGVYSNVPANHMDFDDEERGFGYGDESPDDDYTNDYGISKMVGNRLKICDSDEASSDDEDHVYTQPLDGATIWSTSQSYDSYHARVTKELRQDYGEDDAS